MKNWFIIIFLAKEEGRDILGTTSIFLSLCHIDLLGVEATVSSNQAPFPFFPLLAFILYFLLLHFLFTPVRFQEALLLLLLLLFLAGLPFSQGSELRFSSVLA